MSTEVVSKSQVPQSVLETLDKKYFLSDYNSMYGWNFNLAEASPVESRFLQSVQEMFNSPQRWEPEALQVYLDTSTDDDHYHYDYYEVRSDWDDLEVKTINLGVVLYAKGYTPTRQEGFLGMRTVIDLKQTIDKSIQREFKSEEKDGMYHVVHSHGPLSIEPFGEKGDLENAKTPYYMGYGESAKISPFYYYRNDGMGGPNIIAGEDLKRVIFKASLYDGREILENYISRKLSAYEGKKVSIRKEILDLRLQLAQLITQSPTGQLMEKRLLLEDLKLRPDPFGGIEG